MWLLPGVHNVYIIYNDELLLLRTPVILIDVTRLHIGSITMNATIKQADPRVSEADEAYSGNQN